MRLEGKRAFITGADSGIGRATAATFAREGADVAIHYHSDERGAEQTAGLIRNHGRRCEVIQADFEDPANGEGLIERVIDQLGGLDVLVNNAGMGGDTSSSLDMDRSMFEKILNVNLVVPFILARDAAKVMVAQGSGSIINITSVHEEIPQPGDAA
jgi:glucose 1-dehydrogenase